jgi:hypothetical protein
VRSTALYLAACLLAAVVPLLPLKSAPRGAETSAAFPGWPTHFEGRQLTALPLSEREQRFGGDFPGRVARFTDGEREIVVRWVTEASRKLHPASDCFEGVGYRVEPLPLRVDDTGQRWGSFMAVRQNEKLRVFERIYADGGDSWSDVSAWYWAAAGDASAGPWWAITIAENITEPSP